MPNKATTTTITKLLNHHHRRRLCTTTSLPNPAHLLRVSTILYQQQTAPSSKLHTNLHNSNFNLTHEFFLQLCNNFPFSWRPIYNFHLFTLTQPHFTHSSTTFNKMLHIIGNSKNIDLFWQLLHEMRTLGLVNDHTFRIALKTLASARELKKCVEFFHEFGYSLERLNKVVETLCEAKLIEEAKYIVVKMKPLISPSGFTYGMLVCGFCDVGNLIEASKLWNLTVDEGFELGDNVIEKMIDTLFKINRFDDAKKLFRLMGLKSGSSYRVVIKWMCKRGKIGDAHNVFDEMLKRGFEVDNVTIGFLIYGLLSKGRVREGYRVFEGVDQKDLSVYHGLIKGLLRLRRSKEATQVFREMISSGCEPIMHTYIMLLQGHLGKRGRKGHDPLVNFDSIFVGGLVKVGKSLEASKYVERILNGGQEVPRFDYNSFLHCYSNEEGVVMFEEVGKKLREVGLVDLADIFGRFGEKMATRERRRNREIEY